MSANPTYSFRVWSKKSKKWQNDIFINSNGDLHRREYAPPLNKNNYIVQRSLGINDKNEKKMFEGDIIILDYKGITQGNYVIKYFAPCLCYVFDTKPTKRQYLQDHPIYDLSPKLFGSTMTVLGNYLENKELLNLKFK